MDKTERLAVLFDNHSQYALPSYQRGYAWKTTQVDDFLTDLAYINDNNNSIQEHFFGSILLAPPNIASDKTIKIVDGQQRVTTSVLFLICARNFFHTHKDNSARAAKYLERLEKIIYTPPINSDTNLNKPRLTLSKPNKKFFLTILRHRSTIDPTDLDVGSNDSNILLANAYKTIHCWINQQSGIDIGNDKSDLDVESAAEKIYNFVNTLTGKFRILPCNCKNESEAYRIFNLVNNRGTKLSDSDLIKSFLFGRLSSSGISDEDLESYDASWNDMRHYVTSRQAADYDLDRYLWHHLLAFYSSILATPTDPSKSIHLKQKYMYNLYEELVELHHVKPQDIIKNLHDWSYTLSQIRNPTEVNFIQKDNVIHYLKKIKNVNAVFVYPVILAGYKKYWKAKNYKEFEALVMLCFKYHIRMKAIGTSISLGDYQTNVYEIMNRVTSGDPVIQIIRDLIANREKYPRDDRIKANLQDLRIKNSQLAISLLEEIESVYSKKRSPYNVTLEHVMPKAFDSWEKYIRKTNGNISLEEAKILHKQHYTLLGNLTLLPANINISISNKSFDDKKSEYAKHKTFRLTELISHEPIWNAKAITDKQIDLTNDLLTAINLENIIEDLNLS